MQDEIQEVQQLVNLAMDFFVNYSFQVVGAIVILVLGWIAARFAGSFLLRFLERKEFDITLSRFFVSALKITIFAFAFIIALGKFGITIAPFVAALAAMAFGASFAIQGPLSNYGAGLVIVLSRPFVVGNTITIAGVNGVVEEVRLGATTLTDEDGVTITIPNKHIVGEIIHNSGEQKIVEEVVGISYNSDPEEAIQVIGKALEKFQAISKEPAPRVGIQEFGDSSINIGLRYCVPTKRYFDMRYTVNLAVYKTLKKENIEIPFPQRDVHVYNNG